MKQLISYTRLLILSLMLSSISVSFADEAVPDILTYTSGDPIAEASLEDLVWLIGDWRWEGDVFGQKHGEYIIRMGEQGQMPALAHGYSRYSLFFNEIQIFKEFDGGIEWRLKHFGKELKGWEPQYQPIVRPLIKKTENALYFHDFTFVKESLDRFVIYANVKSGTTNKIITVPHVRIK